MFFCVYVFLLICFVRYVFIYVFLLYIQKLKKTRRKHKKIIKKHINKQKNSKKNIKQTEIQYIQPSTQPRIDISLVPAGRFLFFLFVCCSSSLFLLFVCFYMCLFDCKCKSLKRRGENIKTQKIIKEHLKHIIKKLKEHT